MQTVDRQGKIWTLWDCTSTDIPTGPVVAMHRDGVVHFVSNSAYLHWPGYISNPEYNIVAYQASSTANANDVGLPCLREQQFDAECDRAD